MTDGPILTITRGLPASGKTTYARARQASREVVSEPHRTALMRVNRDDLRAMLHVGDWSADKEALTKAAEFGLVACYLGAGADVICDDTNLTDDVMDEWRRIVAEHGAQLMVKDLRDVPVEECIRRDAEREQPVGADVIRKLAERL